MKLTVTGCNGNIGRHVVLAALNAGHVVHGADNSPPRGDAAYTSHPNFSFSQVDLRDYDRAYEVLRGSDAVIHLAAVPTPGDYLVNTHNT